MKLIASWSGGKDSCLALYKALQQGHSIRILLNFMSEEYKRCCFHGISNDLMHLQAQAMNIPIMQKSVPKDMLEYERHFKLAVNAVLGKDCGGKGNNLTNNTEENDTAAPFNSKGVDGMIFGDIYLDEHKQWVERVCSDIGILPVEPLWNIPPEKVVREFIDCGFKAIIVSAKADIFDEDFLGCEVNHAMIDKLMEKNICPCGENGEFHTFVYDGPLFKKTILIRKTEKILKEGFWKHWFLDIRQYELR